MERGRGGCPARSLNAAVLEYRSNDMLKGRGGRERREMVSRSSSPIAPALDDIRPDTSALSPRARTLSLSLSLLFPPSVDSLPKLPFRRSRSPFFRNDVPPPAKWSSAVNYARNFRSAEIYSFRHSHLIHDAQRQWQLKGHAHSRKYNRAA